MLGPLRGVTYGASVLVFPAGGLSGFGMLWCRALRRRSRLRLRSLLLLLHLLHLHLALLHLCLHLLALLFHRLHLLLFLRAVELTRSNVVFRALKRRRVVAWHRLID